MANGNNMIRRFTKEDWFGWAGAEKFKSGSEPWIYERTIEENRVELTIIADRNGAQIILTPNDEEEFAAWGYEQELTAIQAHGLIIALKNATEGYDQGMVLAYDLDHWRKPEFKGFKQL